MLLGRCAVLKLVPGLYAFGIIFAFLLRIQPARNQEVMDTTPASELRRLREDLLLNYDRNVRPVKDPRAITSVLVYFDVRHIVALDEKYQTLTVEGVLMMKWTDDHLKWDPASYSGISMVRFRPQDIWIPDIHSLFNVKKSNLLDAEDGLPIQVSSNGSIKWYPPTLFDVPCSSTYRHYPFDTHNCSIAFGAWTYSGDDIHLQTFDLPLSSQSSAMGTEWMLTNLAHENELITEKDYFKYHMVRVKLVLKRTSTMYRYVCVVPTLIVLVSSVFAFWLLPTDGSRYLIGCSNVIMMSLLLQHLAVTVPAGREIPLIGQYSATCLCMSGAFLVITVITQLIRNCSGTPPHLVLRLAHQYMDRYLCLFLFSETSVNRDKALGDMTSTSDGASGVFPGEDKNTRDWMIVSLVADRIAFWTFVFTYIILLGVLASV